MIEDDASDVIRKVWARHSHLDEYRLRSTGAVRRAIKATPHSEISYITYTAKEDGLHGTLGDVDVLVEPYA